MARVLKISIQILWVMLALPCVYILAAFLWALLSGKFIRTLLSGQFAGFPPGWISTISLLSTSAAVILICGIIAFTAYAAIFRFSDAVIGPSVFVVWVIMFATAMHGMTHDFQPMVDRSERTTHSAILPFLDLALLFVIVLGSFRFYRTTVRVIYKALFPYTPPLKPLLS